VNFKQKLAAYKLQLLEDENLPDLAITGLMEGLDSESLIILAGMSKTDNIFSMKSYFKHALEELMLKIPDIEEANEIIIDYYSELIINRKLDSFLGFKNLLHAIGFDNVIDIKYKLMKAYHEYIIIDETENEGLIMYDRKKSKESFILEASENIIIFLTERKNNCN
jgi:hypothetical protein